ncbi:MAG: cell surface protein SprA [Ignavibacteria bacterium]|nr:cell surface protein SprA [Ignavibacteria bacterium]
MKVYRRSIKFKDFYILFFFLFFFSLNQFAKGQELDTSLLNLKVPEFAKSKIPSKRLFLINNLYRYPDMDNPRFKYIHEGMFKYFDIDPDVSKLHFRYAFWNDPITYDYTLDLEDYLVIRKEAIQKEIWDSLSNSYDLKVALSGGDIARILSQATGLTIPIPSNPLITIFGKPEISLNVNGEVNIRLGWRWDIQNLGSTSAFGQTQSSPMFSQDIRVNVTGKIGDKLAIGTDWNTRRQLDFDNKFKIGYQGEDDDIIKLLEVGNVTMPIPSTLIGGGQSLFGVRADFQFGPLFLKTIASQKRGERRFVDVRGGTSKQYFALRAYDYAKNHFFLDTAYRSIYREYFKNSTPVIPVSSSYYRVKELEVYESTTDVRDNAYGGNAVAFADLEPKRMRQNELYDPQLKFTPIQTGVVERGTFMRLDSTRYKIDYNLGTLSILSMRQDRYYAVAYRIEGPTPDSTDDLYYGTLSTIQSERDTLILKLIFRPNLLPAYKSLWARQMKNIYQINATNVSVNETKINLWYINQNNDSSDVLPGVPDKLVTILQVDQVNNSTGAPPSDGQFDLRPPFFNPIYGEITFPSLEPFREGIRSYFERVGTPQLAEQYVYGEVYDTTYETARRNTARDRFLISGEVSGRLTDRISLGAFNLSPNSVRVTLDGVPLREYDDYIIDYYSGTLTLRNPRASLPNANLKIEYEQQDIFSITTKTLLGLRADYQLFKTRSSDASIGFTSMYYQQSLVTDRVRLGDEPVSNAMFGFDAKMNLDLPWLTKIVDLLPFHDTKANSSFNIRGEWAMISPNPNRRRSDVISDRNEPVVYIDDFEGAQRYISLSLTPSLWTHSSPPQDESIGPDDSTRAKYRGRLFWWQYALPRIPIRDVYPNRDYIPGQANLSALFIDFDPLYRGIYNKNPEYLDPLNPLFDSTNIFANDPFNRERIWGGMTKLISTFNTNFDNENIEFIEIMMKIESYEPGKTKMFLELGQISEDIIPNQRLDTEDGITKASPMPNGIIDIDEDVGIDALNDDKEKIVYPYPLNLEKDPARDNFKFDFGKDDATRQPSDFIQFNNYEGNAISEMGQYPDLEVLNRNNGQTISLANDYFLYEIQLNPDQNTNPQIVGGNPEKGWLLYRIPVRKPNRIVGNPTFANIQYSRVWFKGGHIKLAIVEWRLVGAHWQRSNNIQSNVNPNDSVLQVAFVNLEENKYAPDFYTMPPGVQAPRRLDNPDPTRIIRMNEQSLSISVRNLRYGEERLAVRYFRNLDIFYYKKLKFFVHGDGTMPENIVPGVIPPAYAFIRFGIDSLNYYEYRVPLLRGWQDIEINLSDLTSIKQIRDSTRIYERQVFPVANNPLALYVIRGNPILTRVLFFGFGIANPNERYPNELTTTMWINELRLISPENRNDWSAIASSELKLADFATINTSFNHSRPNFHRLEERFGNRITSSNYSINTLASLEKLLPKFLQKFKIPFTFTHSEQFENPEFVANNDINLLDAADAAKRSALESGATDAEAKKIRDEVILKSQTLRIQDSWAITGMRLGLPIEHWLINETFNKVAIGYSYSQEYERSPIYVQRFNWIWNLTLQYSNSIPEILAFRPLSFVKAGFFSIYTDWKINLLPNNISLGLNMMRRRQTEQSRFLDFPSPVIRNFSAVRNAQFSWKLSENGLLSPIIDYSFSTTSTLVPFEIDEYGRQRSSSQILKMMFFRNGHLLNLGSNNIHTQTVSINFRPRPPLGKFSRYFDNTGSYQVTYSWNDPLQPDPRITNIVKSASWNSSIRYNLSLRYKNLLEDALGITTSPAGTFHRPTTTPDTTPRTFWEGLLSTLKTIFVDFEKVDFIFNQTNSSNNPGVFGGTGFDNFWSRGFIFRESEEHFGPSFAYQLGLVGSPHGSFKIVPSSNFPYFGFKTSPGRRPENAILQENFNQRTTFEIRTTRRLWQGANLDLNWRSELAFNKNQTVVTDSLGIPTFTNVISTQSLSRTYLTLPTIFYLNIFNNNIENVIRLYNKEKEKILATNLDTIRKNQLLLQALTDAFHKGLEAFSIFRGEVGKFLPAINWAFRWEGLEKWDLLKPIAPKRILIEHIYSSKYQENALLNDNGKTIQGQSVQYGFQPLIGISISFDENKYKGVFTTSVRYSTTTTFQVNSTARSTIVRQTTDEFQAQGSYTLRGFEFPFLNLVLKNDLEFSLLSSLRINRRATYDVLNYTDEKGRTLDGNTQIIFEPRARYSISNRLSASFFMRYEGTLTEGASSPGFSNFQVGLDIRLSISGGR